MQEPKSPVVSAIIPTYNRAHLVGRALHSVLAQTFQDFEIIVVDDASSDRTEELVASFGDPHIRYLRHEHNRGGSAARNTGIKAARGEYLAFLDSDDEWLPDKLDEQLRAFSDSDLDAVGAVVCGSDVVEEDISQVHQTLPKHRGWIYEDLLAQKARPWNTSAIMVRVAATERTFFFDESLPAAQDLDYLLQLSKCVQVEIVQEPLVRVYRHTGPHVWNDESDLKARLLLIEKYAGDLRSLPDAAIRHYKRIAALSESKGDPRAARKQLIEIFKIRPSTRVVRSIARLSLGERQFLVFEATARMLYWPMRRAMRIKNLFRSRLSRESQDLSEKCHPAGET